MPEADYRKLSPAERQARRLASRPPRTPREQLADHWAALLRDPELCELAARLPRYAGKDADAELAKAYDALQEEADAARLERRWREYQDRQDYPRERDACDMLCDVIDVMKAEAKHDTLYLTAELIVAVARHGIRQAIALGYRRCWP